MADRCGSKLPDTAIASPLSVCHYFILMDQSRSSSPADPSSRSPVALVGAFLLGLAVPSPASVAAQLVDSGVFQLYVDGEPAGTEEFTIHRRGTGGAQEILAMGTVTMRSGRVCKTLLQVQGPGMTVAEYQVSVAGPDTAVISLVRAGNRLTRTIVTPGGERVREYRARSATTIFEDGVAHHYFVLGAFLESGSAGTTLHAFTPLADEPESTLQLQAGPRMLQTGQAAIETTRVRLGTGEDAGAAWFDVGGRLVRVSLPRQGFLAVRVP